MRPWIRISGAAIAAASAGAFMLALSAHAHLWAGALGVCGVLGLGMALNSSHQSPAGEVRKFGLIALVFFGILFALAVWRGRPAMTGVFGAFAVLGAGCVVLPRILAPLQGGWVTIAMGFANGVNGVFLIIAWYLVITPSGLLRRVIAGRPIPFSPDKKAETYWTPRKEPLQPRERYIKRY